MYCWDVVESMEKNKIDGRGGEIGHVFEGRVSSLAFSLSLSLLPGFHD